MPGPPPRMLDHWRRRWRHSASSVRWVALVSPWASESFFEIGASFTTRFLDFSPAPDGGAYLEPMLNPDVPVRSSGMHLMIVAMAAKDRVRGLAIDVFIAAAQDGRLDSQPFGRQVHDLLDGKVINATRLALAVAEVARTSVLHTDVVHSVIEEILFGDGSRPPHQLHQLLQLELDISIELGRGIESPHARAYLDQLKKRSPSSKQGRLARQLLALTGGPSSAGRSVSLAALRGRLERAERWAVQLPA